MFHFLKKYIIIIPIILLCFFLYTIDDDLDPEPQRILEQYNNLTGNQAFFYLMGIDTAEQDPIAVGKNIFEQGKIIADVNDFIAHVEHFDQFEKKRKKLAFPSLEADILCDKETPCFKKIAANIEKYKQKIQQHQILIQRYQKFLTFDQYQTASDFNYHIFLRSYRMLVDANKLVLLNAIIQAFEKQPQQAMNNLLNNLQGLRKQLGQMDNLLEKMIIGALIAQNLDTLSLILHENHLQLDKQLKPLSKKEKEFEIIFERELVMSYKMTKSLKQNISFYNFHWLYKPNISMNKVYLSYKKLLEKNKLAPKDFAKLINQKEKKSFADDIKTAWFYFRNPEGERLVATVQPSYVEYLVSFFELDAKISLFNQVNYQGTTNFNTIKNPFFEKEFAFLSKDKRNLCLKPIYLADQGDKRPNLCLKLIR